MKQPTSVNLNPPHIHSWQTSAKAAWICTATLLPIVIVSVLQHGTRAILVWTAAVSSALIADLISAAFLKRFSTVDGTSILTGMLIALMMPVNIPLYIPVFTALFGILVVKTAFGGLGSNWMNPALGGIAFAYANWPLAMTNHMNPGVVAGADGWSGPTPLAIVRGAAAADPSPVMDILQASGYPLSASDSRITGILNDILFSRIGARLPDGYVDLFISNRSGALGESALIVVLLGSIILLACGLVKVEIPIAMIGSFALLVRIFGTGLPGEYFMKGDILFALANGGFLVAAFYLATDPVTSPVDNRLALLYGLGIGFLAFLFRRWGAWTAGVSYAVLTMNILVPFLERRLVLLPRTPRKGLPR
jgi:electron transport complex protein RnfD